jgi:AraC family transcriptional regulator, regulatory protein of adaptative response / methylated-DNA-[protein]-cysteine methyltransferase
MNPSEYQTIAMILNTMEQDNGKPLEATIAHKSGLSPAAIDLLFMGWAGVDLQHFLHAFNRGQIRRKLEKSAELFARSNPPGQPSAGRSHACNISCSLIQRHSALASRQGRYQEAGLTISHGLYPSPFGTCLLAVSGEQICHLSFVDAGQEQPCLAELRKHWPQATLMADDTMPHLEKIRQIFAPDQDALQQPLSVLLLGTSFQLQVWQALLTIPWGSIISYQGLAETLGCPAASRAVANAVAANPVSWLIPCHRVIRKTGEIHNYRWGRTRKMAMLGWEACRK